MDNVSPVRSRQSHGDLDRDCHRLTGGQPSFFLYIPLEGNAVHQLHDDVVGALLLSDIVYIDDVGMHQPCGSLCLDTEFGDKGGVLRKLLFEHLDSHHAVEPVVFCLIYIGHASGTDFFQHLIAVRNQHSYLEHFLLRIPVRPASGLYQKD